MEVAFTLYGAKEIYWKIQKLVEEKNLENSILFKGKNQWCCFRIEQSKITVDDFWEHECFPMVILEAHSSGVPVISFDAPTGPRNIIHHNKDGILVDNNNEDEFVEILENLALNQEKNSGFVWWCFTKF